MCSPNQRSFTIAPPIMNLKPSLWPLVFAALALGGCKDKQDVARVIPPMPVTVATVTAADNVVYSEFVGQTVAEKRVEITARVEGVLASINFKDGAYVNEGDLLFTIDDQQLQAVVAQARAAVAQSKAASETAQRELERMHRIHAQGVVTDADLDTATMKAATTAATYLASQAALQGSELQLGYCRITAPISGQISGHTVSIGNLVGRGQSTVLTTLVSVDPIRARFNIDERFFLEVSKRKREGTVRDDIFELVLGDGSTYAHRGSIAFADNQVDPKTGTLLVEVLFPNPERTLRPGLFGRVRFPLQVVKDAIVVPQRAVQELLATYSVIVVTADNQAEFRPVKVGARIGPGWLITAGLKPGERIVVEGGLKLRPGAAVVVVPAK